MAFDDPPRTFTTEAALDAGSEKLRGVLRGAFFQLPDPRAGRRIGPSTLETSADCHPWE
jgi:hypothetical protein